MVSRKNKALLLISILMLTGITAVSIYFVDKNRADVKIGFLEGDLHQLAFYVARENGFYEKENITIKGVSFANGGDVMTSFAASKRSIDMAYFGFAPALYHRFNNPAANITVLAGVNVNGSALIVKNDSSIQTGADLEGLKIAVPARHNMQDFILSMILNNSGLTYGDIDLEVGTTPSDMVIKLQGGSIDGYVAWEPHCIKGTINDVGKYLYKSSDVWANHPCCIIATHNEFLENNASIVNSVLKVHKQATDWILKNWDAAKAIAMDKMNLSEIQASIAMANIGYVYDMDLAQMELFVEKLVKLNPGISMDSENIPAGLNASTFIDWFVDPSYIEAL
ncbi:ABC transporter substrate-binding protein [Promethearchaeum syntrophicum]|uniref:ABC transporter substrate-binding protein n=1 Tax=Promethearchaeum syntrophicum TaxID=2594042 RepID=A0A5B9D930_9ARCH|nr:ABC transporter substrate-binding protein [Candidatus Prometheoarchaeum syntrophicum]QEE15531.1 alkanesulfonate transporter substrate-binding subunit [Candidatus Prometheoarchaeum syntrophicum]